MNLTKQQRQVLLTAFVAAVGAIVTEHMIKPGVKRRLRV